MAPVMSMAMDANIEVSTTAGVLLNSETRSAERHQVSGGEGARGDSFWDACRVPI
jgi:hypothetical protein